MNWDKIEIKWSEMVQRLQAGCSRNGDQLGSISNDRVELRAVAQPPSSDASHKRDARERDLMPSE
jgi:hypothetical protein